MRLSTLLLLMTCAALPAHAAEPADGRALFAQLAKLAGTWTGTAASGRTQRVDYRLSAAGTVLVETWTLAPGRESLTLYALDGDRLLATHYCPQGNQPRLEYTGTDATGRAQFRFLDGTNLHVPGRAHQQAFWIRVDSGREFSRAETYVENDTAVADVEEGEMVRYTRLAE